MSFDVETLYKLLPAEYRKQDIGQAEGPLSPGSEEKNGQGDTARYWQSRADQAEKPILSIALSPAQTPSSPAASESMTRPLWALFKVIGEQVAVLEENLAQLYDDQFIETCAEWAVPYIGDLVNYHIPHSIDTTVQSLRSDVANTISYRRRKGTALLLEQLVRDVTGWDVHVVEFFKLLATTQHTNRPQPIMRYIRQPQAESQRERPENGFVDLRKQELLEDLGTPFERVVRTADMRSGGDIRGDGDKDGRAIDHGRGRYNIPNIGIFLWRLVPYALTDVEPVRAFASDERRYFFNPLGCNTQLFTLPCRKAEANAPFTTALDVAAPISRSMFERATDAYYGEGKSLVLKDAEKEIPLDTIVVADLSDEKDARGNLIRDNEGHAVWANMSEDKIAIDPELGRITFPRDNIPGQISCSFHYGFSADMGGGEYYCSVACGGESTQAEQLLNGHTSIREALSALQGKDGIVEITNSRCYKESLSLHTAVGQQIELRAADFCRPLLMLEGSKRIPEMLIEGEEGSAVTISGLLISNGPLRVRGNLARLTLRHCTLVPGLSLLHNGEPAHRSQPSLVVESASTCVEIDHCIVGGLRVAESASVHITDSIVDATGRSDIAYAGYTPDADHTQPGGPLSVESSTIIGTVATAVLELASNSIFLAQSGNYGSAPLHVERQQEGCVRFSFVPVGAQLPIHRYQCLQASAHDTKRLEPRFTSTRYGDPGYCQLSQRTASEIWQGADNRSEMGAFRRLYQWQREVNLRTRLDEYLRFGFERNIFYMT